ncbi:hypothetical protein LP416_10740 [Polaromonas sp. P2-4]|nr:hypothetical protein LP416_10740 [Polaromonas sp. P2-4]
MLTVCDVSNRTEFQAERRHMMQAWPDYPDGLRRGADVLPFKTRRTS